MAKSTPTNNPKLAEYLGEVSAYNRIFDSWSKRAKSIVRRYRDDEANSAGLEDEINGRGKNRFNILWSNVQTLQPALYARSPKPEVERRYKDRDPIGRLAAEIAERVAQYVISQQSFDEIMKQARDDFLLAGRGTVWVRYVPEFGSEILGYDDEEEEEGPIYEVTNEETRLEFILWRDFGHNVARSWEEVTKVWRNTYMTRSEVKARFGEDMAKVIPYAHKSEYADDKNIEERALQKKARILEMWCKDTRTVHWICPDYKMEFLDERKDPLGLRGFFPCPRPIYANLTTDSLVPIPDYNQYGRRAEDLNKMVAHREDVMGAVRVSGAYDASQPELGQIMNEKRVGKLVASKNWNQLQQAGGLKGVMDFIDITPYVAAIAQFDVTIGQEKAAIEELTGLSDIVRGYTAPSETATAQQIKGQFATLRLDDRQREIQRFARDVIEIMTEISVEHYEDERIAQMVDITQRPPEEQQMFPAALQILRDDKLRTYKITIETDSTLNVDQNAEKQQRTEAGEAMGKMLATIIPMIEQAPPLAPILIELLLFMVRSFPESRPLEFTLEQSLKAFMAESQKKAGAPPPEAQKMQAELQIKQQTAQADAQLAQQKQQSQTELQRSQLEMDQQRMIGELQLERERLIAELAIKQMEADANIQIKRETAQQNAVTRAQQMAVRDAQTQAQNGAASFGS